MKRSSVLLMATMAFLAAAVFLLIEHTPKIPEPSAKKSDGEGNEIELLDGGIESHIQPPEPKDRRSTPDDQPQGSESTRRLVTSDFDVALENSSFGGIHRAFKEEERDESWASAMESGLGLAIQRSQATNWATIVEIECRTSICEVRGYMPDPMENQELDPGSLLTGDLGAGWWQGSVDMISSTHTYEGEDVTRFVLIIADTDRLLELIDSLQKQEK